MPDYIPFSKKDGVEKFKLYLKRFEINTLFLFILDSPNENLPGDPYKDISLK